MISRQRVSARARSPWRWASAACSNTASSADGAMGPLLRRLFGRGQPLAELGKRAFRHQRLLFAAIGTRDRAGGQRREEAEIHIHRLEARAVRAAGDMR